MIGSRYLRIKKKADWIELKAILDRSDLDYKAGEDLMGFYVKV